MIESCTHAITYLSQYVGEDGTNFGFFHAKLTFSKCDVQKETNKRTKTLQKCLE